METISRLLDGRRTFASDNCASTHPHILAALAAANVGHAPSYGADPLSAELERAFCTLFETDLAAFCVFNGTGANCAALSHLVRGWGGVVCADMAHINTSETAAPERIAGVKLQPLPSHAAKITPAALAQYTRDRSNPHHARPQVLSLSQTTELGTVYTFAELAALCDAAHRAGMRVHVDGARFSNAAVALNRAPAELSWKAGVDVLSYGGYKNGCMFGEVVLFFDRDLAVDFPYTRKNSGQLPSKSRYIAAQYLALLEGALWRANAENANAMATRLVAGLQRLGMGPLYPPESNQVFVRPPAALHPLMEAWGAELLPGEYRLVTSFDTEAGDVDAFLAAASSEIG